eukprot:CAMPEP_0173470976 /NCGR_PEP_ID=MMETSP1357-20121228/78152_1 /TAXON_ID=77926 /ORGANISM="Hemiselmis rufescens, Strain PCC563" /LENGTH=147 /DNA_ID=CAMNT_0014439275 /DNA_START=3118 /DNA_END=3561 /DNA_ORIENTATION=-
MTHRVLGVQPAICCFLALRFSLTRRLSNPALGAGHSTTRLLHVASLDKSVADILFRLCETLLVMADGVFRCFCSFSWVRRNSSLTALALSSLLWTVPGIHLACSISASLDRSVLSSCWTLVLAFCPESSWDVAALCCFLTAFLALSA